MRLSLLAFALLTSDPSCNEAERGERARRAHESKQREERRTEDEMYKQTARPDDNPYRNAYPSGPSAPSPVQPDVR